MTLMKCFESLDPMGLMNIVPQRMQKIGQASDSPLPKDYPMNALARALHPSVQHVKIAGIKEHGSDAKSFTLVPDEEKGTKSLAYFSAGQYLSVSLKIGHSVVNKPYSICSSPKDALEGKYVLTIKRAPGGFASEYILNSWKTGDSIDVSAPDGTFTYEPLRDGKTIVGIAGGSGITPFHSLAKSIAEGTEDCSLVLLYGSRSKDSILLKDDFDKLMASCSRIKVIHVLSDEDAEGYELGFINEGLIRKYAPEGSFSIFLCGPQAMYSFVDKEIEKLNIEKKWIRHELFGQFSHPENCDDYPADAAGKTFKLTVIDRDKTYEIKAEAGESLLTAMERAGINAPSRCRSGECGVCHSYLASGKVYIPKSVDGRRLADSKFGYIHPCCSFPISDVTLEVPVIR